MRGRVDYTRIAVLCYVKPSNSDNPRILLVCSLHSQFESKNHPLRPAVFWHFSQTLENFKSDLHTYYTFNARLQSFIQLSPTLTKLCHIKRDYLVHIICAKCPPSAETHAFRRLRKSLIALLIVICGKSSQICFFYNVNKHAGYDMTSTVTPFAQ